MIVKVDGGDYTINAGTNQFTVSGLNFVPTIEGILVILNITQSRILYAAAASLSKEVTITPDVTPTGIDYIFEYFNAYPALEAGDELHIQLREPVSVQYPLPTDGDSVYVKDISILRSNMYNFSGAIYDLFNELHTVISDTTANNPKELLVHFERTIVTNVVGLGAYTGNFSNVKIEIINSGDVATTVIDESADNTKHTNRTFPLPVTSGFNAIKFTFNTPDPVSLSNCVILKTSGVVARLQATKPDNTVVDINATTQGNLKNSIEELENNISVNSNTQLKVTQFLESGREGMKITDGATDVDVDALGSLKTMEPSLIVGASFEGSVVDPNFWSSAVTGSATITQNGEILIDTGTTADSTAQFESERKSRKVPGTVNQFRGVGHLDTVPQVNNVRTIGAYDDDNGAFFKIDGTILKVVTRAGGIDTEVASGNFNGDVTSVVLDTDIHRWAIDYTALSANFWYDGTLIHSTRSTQDPWTRSLTLPIRLENKNSGGNTTNNKLHFQLLTIVRYGKLHTEKKSYYRAGITAGIVLKYGAGELSNLLVSGVAQGSVITLYDNTAASGKVLWSSGTMSAQTQPFDLNMGDLPFAIGLTIVISGANSNLTVVYE